VEPTAEDVARSAGVKVLGPSSLPALKGCVFKKTIDRPETSQTPREAWVARWGNLGIVLGHATRGGMVTGELFVEVIAVYECAANEGKRSAPALPTGRNL
jgi:hypothetical protein